MDDLAISNFIELELPGMSEMLENLPVFIGDRNFHDRISFILIVCVFRAWICLPMAVSAMPVFLPAANAIIAAGDDQLLSVHKTGRDFPPGAFADLLHGGAGDIHLRRALLVGPSL